MHCLKCFVFLLSLCSLSHPGPLHPQAPSRPSISWASSLRIPGPLHSSFLCLEHPSPPLAPELTPCQHAGLQDSKCPSSKRPSLTTHSWSLSLQAVIPSIHGADHSFTVYFFIDYLFTAQSDWQLWSRACICFVSVQSCQVTAPLTCPSKWLNQHRIVDWAQTSGRIL